MSLGSDRLDEEMSKCPFIRRLLEAHIRSQAVGKEGYDRFTKDSSVGSKHTLTDPGMRSSSPRYLSAHPVYIDV